MTTSTLERKPQTQVCKTERNATPVQQTRPRQCVRPRMDVIETAHEFLIRADMPGVRAEDLEIQIEQGELTIHGRVGGCCGEGRSYLLRESHDADYAASLRINGETVDTNAIEAKIARGVLTVRLPKTEAIKPRKISVTAG